MRLIDADAVSAKIKKVVVHKSNIVSVIYYNTGVSEALRVIEGAETVDAEPVRHGRWIPTEFDGYADGYPVWDTWECSECRDEQYGNDIADLLHYCPNCGAKMDEAPIEKEETE